MNRYAVRCAIVVIISFLAEPLWTNRAVSAKSMATWFGPDAETPDLIDLFTRPQLWASSRKMINVFKLPGQQAFSSNALKANNYPDLLAAHAFQLLNDWKIPLALEAGAIKEWDCHGESAAQQTAQMIANVHRAEGHVQYVSMDEPLVSATRACKLFPMDAANRTSKYMATIRAADISNGGDPLLFVGDIEPYPFFRVSTIERWVDDIQLSKSRLDFFHVDIDLHAVDAQPDLDMATDLRALYSFVKSRGIPFGVIFWSGYDPLNSDLSYFQHTMSFVERIHEAIGRPDQAIFQSWVTRSPVDCPNATSTCLSAPCSAADPPYCKEKSIPINLPDNQPDSFSHTRLIRSGIDVLSR